MKNHLQQLLLIFLIAFAIPQTADAHAPDQSYIFMRVYDQGIEGRFEMEIDDINAALGLNLKKEITVDEIMPYVPQLRKYLLERSSFQSDFGKHAIKYKDVDVYVLELGTFVKLTFDLENTQKVPDDLEVTYNTLFDKVPNHQGMLIIEYNWKAGLFNNEALVSLIFTPSSNKQNLDLTDASVMKGFLTMIWMGVWHIFIGTDHILFILALVLPAVVFLLKDKQSTHYLPARLPGIGTFNSWGPVEKFRPAIIYVLTIITFFTISHCITLSLAALDIFNLPSRLVESLIALSIALAAWHNISPLFKKDWVIAFVFGLFHGFGFASVLGDIGLTGEYMVLSLLGFNLGVELGQVAIICAVFPILYYLRKTKYYSRILVYGSVMLIAISLYWFIERAFDVDLLVGDFIYEIYRKVMGKLGLI